MRKYCELQNGYLLIYVPRELDHHEAEQLKAEADMLMGAYPVKWLIFDFAKTEFMDSSGIGVIIGRCKNIGYYGGEAAAQNLNARLKKIFRVSGLYSMIHVVDMEDENQSEGEYL